MKLLVQEAAEQDIIEQFEWYAERGLVDVARQFLAATRLAFDALIATPAIGVRRQSSNPALAGLRAWPLPGLQQFRVYYIDQPEFLIVIRVLHGKRDAAAILDEQQVEVPPAN